jgi:ribonuclease HII
LGVKGPVVSDDELPMSVEIQPFVDARQLSHEQREMIRERVRAQVEAARAEVMAHRDELRELSQQVHFIDSMNRRVIVIGQGNGKSKVEISGLPDLPSIDDDDDSY